MNDHDLFTVLVTKTKLADEMNDDNSSWVYLYRPLRVGRAEVRQLPTEMGSGQAHVDVGEKGNLKPRQRHANVEQSRQ